MSQVMIHTGIRYVGLKDRGLKYEIQSWQQLDRSCGWMVLDFGQNRTYFSRLLRSSLSACPVSVPGAWPELARVTAPLPRPLRGKRRACHAIRHQPVYYGPQICDWPSCETQKLPQKRRGCAVSA